MMTILGGAVGVGVVLRIKSDGDRMVAVVDRLDLVAKLVFVYRSGLFFGASGDDVVAFPGANGSFPLCVWAR
jgi:hypothetical protein